LNHNHLPELGRVLRVLGEHGEILGRETPPEKLQEIADDIERAQELIRKTTGPKPLTRCKEHPFGAVDEDAPDLCLICQTRRRKARNATQGRPYGGHHSPTR
jgi:hypothetical protein